MPPFTALYGHPPPTLLDYVQGTTTTLQEKYSIIHNLKANLKRTHQSMKDIADQKRKDVTFEPSAFVWLKLQPYRQQTVVCRSSQKLSKCFFGPFKILQRIGYVAYELCIPPDSRIHPVVHVSMLRPYGGTQPPFTTMFLSAMISLNSGNPRDSPLPFSSPNSPKVKMRSFQVHNLLHLTISLQFQSKRVGTICTIESCSDHFHH